MCGKKNSEKKFFKFKKGIQPTNLPDTSQMFKINIWATENTSD